MKKRKTLIVTVSGKRYDNLKREFIPLKMVYTYQVTGSNLSIRKAEGQAVGSFMSQHSVGCCTLQSELQSN